MTLILALNRAKHGDRLEGRDVAKALVMAAVVRVVEDGGATIVMLGSGKLELHLTTGEIFHLGKETVTRVA